MRLTPRGSAIFPMADTDELSRLRDQVRQLRAEAVNRTDVRNEIAPLLQTVAYNGYVASIVGPSHRFNAYQNPRPGDYVVIPDAGVRKEHPVGCGFGVLAKITREGAFTGQGEDAEGFDDEPEPQCTYWYVLLLDGTVFKWWNATVYRVPDYDVDSVHSPLNSEYAAEQLASAEARRLARASFAAERMKTERPDEAALPDYCR